MKKFLITFVFLFGFSAYALYAQQGVASTAGLVTVTDTPGTPIDSSAPTNTAAATSPAAAPSKSTGGSTPTPTPAPAPAPTGRYKDGSYTGSVADAYYGYIQVRATISGGKISDVTFLQYPNDRETSVYINSQAMPYLKREALSAQSANVSGVSGATDTSIAFRQSLASALSHAS